MKTTTRHSKKNPRLSKELRAWLDQHHRDIAAGKYIPFEEQTKRGAESLRRAGLIK